MSWKIALRTVGLTAFVGLAGCGADNAASPQVPVAAPPAAIGPEALVGKWGLAAYHRDGDRARTEKEARAQCGNPYVIVLGPNGGVMMHMADEKAPSELRLKGGSGGRSFLGPDSQITEATDREIIVNEPNLFITRYLNPEIAGRYGDMIYVRCGTR